MSHDITVNHKPKQTTPPRPSKDRNTSKTLKIVVVVLVIAVLAMGGLIWKLSNERTSSGVSNQSEQAELVAKVGTLISLPNEKPIIATVEDKDEFKKHPFYKLNQDVEQGDKILMYTKDKKLVLYFYRPSENKITGVSFANVQDNQ